MPLRNSLDSLLAFDGVPRSLSPPGAASYLEAHLACTCSATNRPSLQQRAFHKGLGLIHESIRERVAPRIAHRQGFSFAFQHKIHTPGEVLEWSPFPPCRLRACDAFRRSPMQALIFGDGVVVGFAFAVTQPSQKGQRNHDDRDTYAEFCAILHNSPLGECPPPEIVTYPQAAGYGTSVG